jgi:hypothetical protein
MHKLLLLVPLLAASCSFPRFVAKKTVELQLDSATLTALRCDTHNGDVAVTGSTAEGIVLRADISVRGETQEEADDLLHLLEVAAETAESTMRIHGKYPSSQLYNRSPSFTFTLTVPSRLSLQLESHNGDIKAVGMAAAAKIETHNGDIHADVAHTSVRAKSHNGDVHLTLSAPGALDAVAHTHNGDVHVGLAADATGTVEASTHNGRTTAPEHATGKVGKRSFRVQVGDGTGSLRATSHNGDVQIR